MAVAMLLGTVKFVKVGAGEPVAHVALAALCSRAVICRLARC